MWCIIIKMPNNCAVAKCPNYGPKIGINYFVFPKDTHLREIWIYNCYRKDAFNPNTSRICSEHFDLSDFDITGTRPRLKKDAIPTKKLLEDREKTIQNKLFDKRKQSSEQFDAYKERKVLASKVKNIYFIVWPKYFILQRDDNVEPEPSTCEQFIRQIDAYKEQKVLTLKVKKYIL